jgi:hypothetical protein
MNLRSSIPSPEFRNKLIKKDQTTTDIAKLMLSCEFKSRADVKKIIHFFYNKNLTVPEICFRVWKYLRENIKYIKEPSDKQTAKTINRIIYDGFGDCKHYSIFAVGILKCLGIPVRFRLVSFERYKKSPSHAYAVAKIKGKEIIIDACIDQFNKESSYSYKFDVSPIN